MDQNSQEKLLVQLTVTDLRNIIRSEFALIAKITEQARERPLQIYRKEDLAKILNVTVQTVADLERCGDIPKRKGKIGKFPYWTHEQIDTLINKGSEN
jgi:hypothetical protein